MDLPKPVDAILKHIRQIDFTKSNTQASVSLFETTIRYLGGLISAHDLLSEVDSRKKLVKDVGLLYEHALSRSFADVDRKMISKF
jgi:virulence-associated protein VapD